VLLVRPLLVPLGTLVQLGIPLLGVHAPPSQMGICRSGSKESFPLMRHCSAVCSGVRQVQSKTSKMNLPRLLSVLALQFAVVFVGLIYLVGMVKDAQGPGLIEMQVTSSIPG